MAWYDLFSSFYDRSLEALYREARRSAAEALRLAPGLTVLDLPVGTGQSLDELAPAVGPGGRVIGVDRSRGMLARARARAERAGFEHVSLIEADVHALAEALAEAGTIDRAHVFLGLSAFPRWEEAFAAIWARLAPGGRCVVVDVHADPLRFRGRMVNLVARADIRRRTWSELERAGVGFSKIDLPSVKQHGGQLFLAVADKDASPPG